MEEENTRKQIVRNQIKNFFNGCQDQLCLSKHCNNFIIQDPQLTQLKQDKEKALKYILIKIQSKEVQIDCALPKQKTELIDSLQEFQELFNLDFQEILNMSTKQQEQKFFQLEQLINKIENEIENNSRVKILKHLDKALEKQYIKISKVIQETTSNFQFFVTLTKLIITLRNFITLENLLILDNFSILLSNLNFQNIYCQTFDILKQRSCQINKDKILELIENILNTITCIKYSQEEIVLLSIEDQHNLTLCFQTLEYFFHFNKLDFYPQQIEPQEFQNDDILTSKEYHLEVIRLIIKAGKEKDIEIPVQIHGDINLQDDFNFLNWHFFYSVAQKIDFLRFESKILQQFEMQNSIQNLIQNPVLLLQGGGGIFLELNLNRQTILEDTLTQLHAKGKGNNLKKTLRIKFKGEPGVDEGGLTKEFFQLLTQKLFDPNFGMFEPKNGNRFLWFNKNSFECNLNFELIGMLLGLALYNSTILKLNFPLAIYKKLKNVELSDDHKKLLYIKPEFIEDKISLEDLKQFEPELFTSFTNLLKNDFSNQNTGFYFQVTYLSWGQPIDYDLIENGGDIEVTEENKNYFVEQYLKWYFVDSIKKQFEPFAIGFHKVLTGELIKKFSANDIFLAICGSEELNFEELKRTTKYDDGYDQNSLTIKHFWKIVLNDFDKNQQKNFLKFLTGSDRAPLRGLSDIKLVISRQGDGHQLPAAHTCFNHLLLPDYQNYDKLKEKLLKSIEHFEGFGLY